MSRSTVLGISFLRMTMPQLFRLRSIDCPPLLDLRQSILSGRIRVATNIWRRDCCMTYRWDEGDRAAATFVVVVASVLLAIFGVLLALVWWMI